MTIFSKNFGGPWPLRLPPWLRLCVPGRCVAVDRLYAGSYVFRSVQLPLFTVIKVTADCYRINEP